MNYLTGIALSQNAFALIALMAGDMPGMVEAGRIAAEVGEQAEEQLMVYAGLGFQAWAESRLGQYAAADAHWARQQEVARHLGAQIGIADWFMAASAEMALAQGRVEDARALAEQTVATAAMIGGVFSAGLAQRVWGAALAASTPPRWDEAEAHMAESVRALESGAAHLEAARTHLAWGRLCLDRDDHVCAHDHLRQAATRFEAAGLTTELDQTRTLLARLRA